jgi:hypothetical protein
MLYAIRYAILLSFVELTDLSGPGPRCDPLGGKRETSYNAGTRAACFAVGGPNV